MAEPALRFPTVDGDRLLDAVMLFGGRLAPCNTNSRLVSLSVSRLRRQWNLLGWAVVVLDMHGIKMSLVSAANDLDGRDNKLCYKSPGYVAYTDAYRRWYGTRKSGPVCITPPDIKLCEHALAFWMTDALSTSPPTGPVKLTAPRMSAQVARIMAYQVRRLGFGVTVVPTSSYHALELDPAQRPKAEAWLDRFVPREVWEARGGA